MSSVSVTSGTHSRFEGSSGPSGTMGPPPPPQGRGAGDAPPLFVPREVHPLSIVPTRMIEECMGRVVVVELKNRVVYRGILVDFDPVKMNVGMSKAIVTRPNGEQSRVENGCFILGRNMRFVMLPEDMERNPMLEEFAALKDKPEMVREILAVKTRRRGFERGGPEHPVRAEPPRRT